MPVRVDLDRDHDHSEAMSKIRLVLFDAFATLLIPRLPVYVQYSQTFEPYLGTLEPSAIKSSFKSGKMDFRPVERSH